jgi:cytochrome c-type biogenesis protein CcmF
MAWVFGISSVLSALLMEGALLSHDFSVGYVAEVGSVSTPTWVTIVSLWSSLNGSILLWSSVLGVYIMGFTVVTKDRFPEHTPYALGTALAVGTFFSFLVASVGDPFHAVSPVPLDGPGPNPLLQNHILMVVHPPMLYLGYVGMTVPFAMGAAALLAGRLDAAWTRVLRRWTMVPWAFLTVGIVLGGWWSYEVLGWGGWWAWDPVENASFMPWLTCSAFLHSAMVMERKDHLKGWTLSLLLASFLLTILGTFMTRSGVFNSVHSFTQSPIGPVFLAFLAIALVFSVVLMAARVDRLSPPPTHLAGPVSREFAFLANNLLFTAFTFTVLLGTVFPLLNEAITDKQISVGQPYFDRMAAPIGVALIFLMGVGPALPWGETRVGVLARRLGIPAAVGVLTVIVSAALGFTGVWPLLTFGFSAFALLVTLREMAEPVAARARALGESIPTAMMEVGSRARRRYGGYVVHIGVLIIAVSHVAATAWSAKDTVTIHTGQVATVGDYALTFQGSSWEEQPHRRSLVARFDVTKRGDAIGLLQPRLNHYKKMGTPIGTPEVHSALDEDLYLSLVNVDEAAGTASIDVLVRPMVWWLWFGGGVMLFGSIIAMWPMGRPRETTARSEATV